MTDELVIPLLDGRILIFDAPIGASPRLREELETWALVPADPDPDTRRGDPAIWVDALIAGQLVHAALQGVTDDSAAWRIFPQAAKFLTNAFRRGQTLDAIQAAARARQRVAVLMGTDAETIQVLAVRRDDDQHWQVELAAADGGTTLVTMTSTGAATVLGHQASTLSAPGRAATRATAEVVEAQSAPDVVRVFVCYAHDSEKHKDLVREFVEFLIVNGIEAHLDAWNQDQRRDWQLWALGQIKAADFVLVIASPRCRLTGDGEIGPDQNQGLRSEMNLLRDLYTGQPDVWLKRILPVILPGYSKDDIPRFLQPVNVDHYPVTELTVTGTEELLRHLTGQPRFVPPPRGLPPVLAPQPRIYRES